MSTVIVEESIGSGTVACMGCDTSEWAFGPLVRGNGRRTAKERLRAFIKWLPRDPRTYESNELESVWGTFCHGGEVCGFDSDERQEESNAD